MFFCFHKKEEEEEEDEEKEVNQQYLSFSISCILY